MNTSKFCKLLSLASAATISSSGMGLINQVPAFAVEVPPGWCVHEGADRIDGDFDGDGDEDALCADKQGGKWIIYDNKRGKKKKPWYTKSSWCTHKGSRIYATFERDGDRRADLQCRGGSPHQPILRATREGRFNF